MCGGTGRSRAPAGRGAATGGPQRSEDRTALEGPILERKNFGDVRKGGSPGFKAARPNLDG